MSKRNLSILLAVLIITGYAAYLSYHFFATKLVPAELIAVLRPAPKQLQEFKLIDQNKNSFTLDHLKNTNTLLFFGYTSCPDICPTTLTILNQLYNQLNKTNPSESYNIVFVSVDPKRDSTEKLSDYMNYFNQDFLAVTGTKTEIDQFARQFGAGYVIDGDVSGDNYLVSHTSSIFLINSQQNFIASFSPPHHAEIIASQLQLIEKL